MPTENDAAEETAQSCLLHAMDLIKEQQSGDGSFKASETVKGVWFAGDEKREVAYKFSFTFEKVEAQLKEV